MGCASSTQRFGDTAKQHQPNTSAKQKFFIVIAHPEPQSMCQSIGNTAIEALLAAGHEVKVTRLYEEHFDELSTRKNFKEVKDSAHFKPPVEEAHATVTKTFADDVEAELQKLEWCDVLIFQFPLYWFALPAVLKGWVDRIFARDDRQQFLSEWANRVVTLHEEDAIEVGRYA